MGGEITEIRRRKRQREIKEGKRELDEDISSHVR